MALTTNRNQQDSFVDFLAQLRERASGVGAQVGEGLASARENIKEFPRAAARLPRQIIDQITARADVVGVDTLRGIADLAALLQSGSERASEEETIQRMGQFQGFVSSLPFVTPLEEAGEGARFRLGLPPKGEELLPDILLGLPVPGRPTQRFLAMFRNRSTGQLKKLDDILPDELDDFAERVVVDAQTGEDVTEEVLGPRERVTQARTSIDAGDRAPEDLGPRFQGSDIPELEAQAAGRGTTFEGTVGPDELTETGIEAGLPPEPRGAPQAGFGPSEQAFQTAEDFPATRFGEDPVTGQRAPDVVLNRASRRLMRNGALVDAGNDLDSVMQEQYIRQDRPVWEMTRDTRDSVSDLTTMGQFTRAANLADAHGIQTSRRLEYVVDVPGSGIAPVDALAETIESDVLDFSRRAAQGTDDIDPILDLINDLSPGPETTGRAIRRLDKGIEELLDRQANMTGQLQEATEGVGRARPRVDTDELRGGINEIDEILSNMRQAKSSLQVNMESFETAFGGLASLDNAAEASRVGISPQLESLHALHDSVSLMNLERAAMVVPEGGLEAADFLRDLRTIGPNSYSRIAAQERLGGMSAVSQTIVRDALQGLRQTDRLAAASVPVRRALQAVRRLLSSE